MLSVAKLTHHFWLLSMMTLTMLLSACQPTVNSETPSLVKSIAWKVDKDGQATWQEVQSAKDWQIFDGHENWGFGEAPIWIRYTLRASLPNEKEPWVIQVRPSFLENLTLIDPATGLKLTSGIYVAKSNDQLKGPNFNFQVQPLAYERDVFLRIQSERSRLILTEVMPLSQAFSKSQSSSWFGIFLIALSSVLALWASTQWVLDREKIMGAFAIKQWIATGYVFYVMGFAQAFLGDHFSSEFLKISDVFFRFWTIGATVGFLTLLIKTYGPSESKLKAVYALLIFIFVLPVLHLFGPKLAITVISNMVVLAGLTMLVWLHQSTPRKSVVTGIPRSVLLVYLMLYGLVNSISPLVFLDWIPLYPPLFMAGLVHAFIDVFLIFLLLQFRAKNMVDETHKLLEKNKWAELQLNQVQQKMDIEQQRRHEQSQFLHMLMHELKTPLSVVSLALGTRNNREENLTHASSAVKDMKDIIDRCILADKTQEPSIQKLHEAIDLPNLTRQIIQNMPFFEERLRLSTPPHLPTLQSDEQLLKIILTNLLDNAAHYSDPSTPVFIGLEVVKQNDLDGIQVRISNTPGLAGWPDAQQVFTKYYRAPGAQRESGSGLGLFLSRQLTNSLCGSLIYEPTHQLVEFVLWLPLHPA